MSECNSTGITGKEPITEGDDDDILTTEESIKEEEYYADTDKAYEVERLICTRVVSGQIQFQVAWKGYAKKDPQWYPQDDIGVLALQEFWEEKPHLQPVEHQQNSYLIVRVLEARHVTTEKDKVPTIANQELRLEAKFSTGSHGIRKVWVPTLSVPLCWSRKFAKGLPAGTIEEPKKDLVDCSDGPDSEPLPMSRSQGVKDSLLQRFPEAKGTDALALLKEPFLKGKLWEQKTLDPLNEESVLTFAPLWRPLSLNPPSNWLSSCHLQIAAHLIWERFGGEPALDITQTAALGITPVDKKIFNRAFMFHYTPGHWTVSLADFSNPKSSKHRVYFSNTLSRHMSDRTKQEIKQRYNVSGRVRNLSPNRQNQTWECGYLSSAIAFDWMAGDTVTNIKNRLYLQDKNTLTSTFIRWILDKKASPFPFENRASNSKAPK